MDRPVGRGLEIHGTRIAQEPVITPHPLREFENVSLAPHSVARTDELFPDVGRAACQVMVDIAGEIKSRTPVNPEVFDQRGFQSKWERLHARSSARL